MGLLIVAGILPAIILVGIGQAFRPDANQPDRQADWTGFLLAALLILQAANLIAYNLGEQGSMLLLLLLPASIGLLAQVLLQLVHTRLAGIFHSRVLIALLLGNLLLGALLAKLTDPFVASVELIGGLLLALAWLIWERAGRSWGLIYLLILLLGLGFGWRIDLNRDVFPSIPWLARASGQLAYLFFMVELLALFRLLTWAIYGQPGFSWRRLALAGLMALPILALAGWQAATAAAWDVATDGLGGIAMEMLAGLAGGAAALLAAWKLPVNRRTPVFILGLVLPLFIMACTRFGTFGLDGPWGRVPIARTERRAASIERAIQRYHDRNNSYPAALDELTPGYLLVLPVPFIIPGQDWCYQGGQDYYRLGYVYRDFFSTPASVKIFASQGQPPNQAWPCDQEAARYPGPAGFYGEP